MTLDNTIKIIIFFVSLKKYILGANFCNEKTNLKKIYFELYYKNKMKNANKMIVKATQKYYEDNTSEIFWKYLWINFEYKTIFNIPCDFHMLDHRILIPVDRILEIFDIDSIIFNIKLKLYKKHHPEYFTKINNKLYTCQNSLFFIAKHANTKISKNFYVMCIKEYLSKISVNSSTIKISDNNELDCECTVADDTFSYDSDFDEHVYNEINNTETPNDYTYINMHQNKNFPEHIYEELKMVSDLDAAPLVYLEYNP